MPRTARAVEAGSIYHVLNRGKSRMTLFRKSRDFKAFEGLLAEGLTRYPVDLLTYCLMGNHWHLVLRLRDGAEALGRVMGWIGVTHVRRHHAHHRTAGGGHLYQGRFKSFVVQEDRHFLLLCRYVEANPVRAKLVERAERWQWSGLSRRREPREGLTMSPWPVDRPANWQALVNRPLGEADVQAVQTSLIRERPLGDEDWMRTTVARLGLEYTLRPRGRPKMGKE